MILLLILCAALLLAYSLVLAIFRDPASGLTFSREDLAATPLHVPRGFLWGSATSAYQVEGGSPDNNWTRFESSVDAAGQPRILNGERAGAGADHWNRHRDDIRLMKDLSLNAYRFSVEWSRIEPSEGKFDGAALAHYAGVARDLRASGIEPMVTLHHFTNPLWFEDRGGFLRDDSPEIFARFVRSVANALGDNVRLWVTINEPTVYALNGYWFGEFPPAERNAKRAVHVMRNLMRAHTAAYRVIKDLLPDSAAGPAQIGRASCRERVSRSV
jgi:beta-glucosidase